MPDKPQPIVVNILPFTMSYCCIYVPENNQHFASLDALRCQLRMALLLLTPAMALLHLGGARC